MYKLDLVFAVFAGLLATVLGSPIGSIQERQLIPTGAVNLNFTHITAHFTPLALLTNSISIDFDIAPIIPDLSLILGLTITHLTFSAGISGTEYVSFDHSFDTPLAVPPTGSINSGIINNVTLPQGGLVTLLNAVLPAANLDIFSAGVGAQVTLLNIALPVPLFLPLTQFNVATTWSPL